MADAARDGQTALALRLAKLLAPAGDVDEAAAAAERNVAFSPLSVHAALALVAAGARGATQAQLLSFLGAPSAAELAAFGRRVADSVFADRADTGGPRVVFGGGVWIDESRGKIRKAFRDVAEEAYKSEARTVGFTTEMFIAAGGSSGEMINKFVKRATDSMITSVVSPSDIDAETDIVLANAVYFKGVWHVPFNSGRTSSDTFHRLDGSPVVAQFMSMYACENYVSCMDGFKVLRLPYRPNLGAAVWEKLLEWRKKCMFPVSTSGGPRRAPLYLDAKSEESRRKLAPDAADVTQYSMFIFLPDKRGKFATMVDVITAAPDYLYSVLPRTEPDLTIIRLPKFEISSDLDLNASLSRLGLSLPFSPEVADLRGMLEEDDARRPTFLAKVVHRAVVKVTEEGTEAAATTGNLRGGGLPPNVVEFIADHPFTFLIMEEQSGVIVFAGHVLDPTTK